MGWLATNAALMVLVAAVTFSFGQHGRAAAAACMAYQLLGALFQQVRAWRVGMTVTECKDVYTFTPNPHLELTYSAVVTESFHLASDSFHLASDTASSSATQLKLHNCTTAHTPRRQRCRALWLTLARPCACSLADANRNLPEAKYIL